MAELNRRARLVYTRRRLRKEARVTDSDTKKSGFWPDSTVDAISVVVVLTALVLMLVHFASGGVGS